MSTHTVAEAATDLPQLIDRALSGEPVLISRDGQPVAELRPIPTEVKSPQWRREDMIAWLEANPPIGDLPPDMDAATRVRQMRDEGP
jgi:antitoxin (DNA-binding transcriptional repressor) of toxin-antitoxin stability system